MIRIEIAMKIEGGRRASSVLCHIFTQSAPSLSPPLPQSLSLSLAFIPSQSLYFFSSLCIPSED